MLNRQDQVQAGSAHVIVAALTSLLAFLVYFFTLAPTITWSNDGADGGDFLAAVATGGVPHPSGYPTYLLLGSLFAQLPVGDIAYRLNLMSAAAAAAAVGVLSLILYRVLHPVITRPTARLTSAWLEALVSAGVALTFAFSSILWSQAVITEVYSLNVLFVALVWWLALRARSDRRVQSWGLCALALSLGLGNHLSLATILPGLLVLSWPVTYQGRKLVLRCLAVVVVMFLLGLTVYAALPIRASAAPIINWGGADSWSGFLWLVSGRLYAPLAFGLPLAYLPGRVLAGLALLARQVAWWGLSAVILGAWLMWRRDRQLALSLLVATIAAFVYAVGYSTSDSYVYLLPAVVVVMIWLSLGLHDLLSTVYARASVERPHRRALNRIAGSAALCLAGLSPLLPLVINYATVDASHNLEACQYGQTALEAAEPRAVIVTAATRDTFVLWYFRYASGQRPDVIVVNGPLLPFAWYTHSLAKHHPELFLPPQGQDSIEMVADLIRNNLPQRPIYLTDSGWTIPPPLHLEKRGTLYQVLAP